MATSTQAKKVGAGLAAAAAGAAAGYYFFYGSKAAKQHRTRAVRWANDLKRDVIAQAKKMERMDRSQLLKIIDGAAGAYETVRSIDPDDLKKAAQELKNNWTRIAQEASTAVKGGVARGRKTAARVRTTAKKSARKAVKKRR